MEAQIKQSTFPLPVEYLKEYVLSKKSAAEGIDPTPKFIIDYKESALKGKYFLSYGANLELSYLMTNFSSEDLAELMGEFLKGDQFYCCLTVADEIAKILLFEDQATGLLGPDALTEFKVKHKDTLDLYTDFLCSLPYAIPMTFKWYGALFKDNLSFLEQRKERVINAAALILKPDFLENFMAIHEPKKLWFEFIEAPMYYGNHFLNFFHYRTSYIPFLYQAGVTKEDECKPSSDLLM